MRNMLDELAVFATVVEERRFTRAADRFDHSSSRRASVSRSSSLRSTLVCSPMMRVSVLMVDILPDRKADAL